MAFMEVDPDLPIIDHNLASIFILVASAESGRLRVFVYQDFPWPIHLGNMKLAAYIGDPPRVMGLGRSFGVNFNTHEIKYAALLHCFDTASSRVVL